MSHLEYRSKLSGFTLLEVMVALAIVAIGLVAVSKAMSSSVSVADQLQLRTVANWVASNRMAELRMSRQFSVSGSSVSEVIMADQNWRIEEQYHATADPNISRVSIRVFHETDTAASLAKSVGFLARYQPAQL